MRNRADDRTVVHPLRRERELRGWSQALLAEQVGAPSASIVSRWERGVVSPSPYYRERLCRLFDKDAAELGLLESAARPAPRYGDIGPIEVEPMVQRRPGAAPPCQLPPAIGDFTDRKESLALAYRILGTPNPDGERISAPVLVVTGSAGVGKTAFAAHVGHRLRSRFPDGQLFVDLQGTASPPLEAADVLAGFLHALGFDALRVPADMRERLQLYRGCLANGRVLVVLDNAASEAQVRPLLPSGPGCAALITSRPPLGALEGAATLRLDEFEPADAVELLARIAGPDRVSEEPDAARAVAALCGCLPLAVRIAGARLVSRPHWLLRKLTDRLDDERSRLDELSVGDLEVRASLGLSYSGLDEPARRAFRRLGLLSAPDFPAWLAAGVLRQRVVRAETTLERLVERRLLNIAGEDCAGQVRYRFHDLVRVFARERALQEDPAQERRAALEHALALQLALAERGRARLMPGHEHEPTLGRVEWTRVDDSDMALAVDRDPVSWFEAERVALIAAVPQAVEESLPELAWELVRSLPPLLRTSALWKEWLSTHEQAAEENRRTGNRLHQARSLWSLAACHLFVLRDYDRAESALQQCLPLFRQIEDRHGEGYSLLGLGWALRCRHELDQAAALLSQGLNLLEGVGDRHGQAVTLRALAEVHTACGRGAAAAVALDRSTALLRAVQTDGSDGEGL